MPSIDQLTTYINSKGNVEASTIYQAIKERIKSKMDIYNLKMKKKLDLHGVEKESFFFNDQVLLVTKDLTPNKLTVLMPRYVGPNKIVETYENQAVTLSISNKRLGTIYNIRNIKHYKAPLE
jgi:hypothetical protein